MTEVDVLIVGAGPAGLSAAAELRRHGASVIVAERESTPGGIPRHTDHLGYGMRDLHRVTTGPRYARTLTERAVAAGADIRLSTTVLALAGTRAELVSPSGRDAIDAGAVVIATGVRERPRSARLVAGDRPAGVFTTGAIQQLSAFHHQRPGKRAVIVGAEHVSFSAILTLRHVGCEVVAMTTAHPRHQTFAPLRLATATRHRVPIHTGVDVTAIVGRRRVEAVELSDGTRLECDTVVFTGDWIPDHELARRSAATMLATARSPVIDARFRTDVRGVFAIGNLVHPAETADVCALDGRSAAGAVTDWLAGHEWPDATPPIAVAGPIAWAAYSANGITLRVASFERARIEVTDADGSTSVGRRRRLVPNRSITVPAASGQVIAVRLR